MLLVTTGCRLDLGQFAKADHIEGEFCELVVQENVEKIPDELFGKPSDDEAWTCCLVPAGQLELFRNVFENLASAHIVRKTSDDEYYEVAMCERCIQYFRGINFDFLPISDTSFRHNVSRPIRREIDVYGTQASDRARFRFIQNAVGAISSARHGRGLDQYYLARADHTGNLCLSVAIRWETLLREIKDSDFDVVRRFFQHCVFIALHAVDDLETACELGLGKRDEIMWLERFMETSFERMRWPSDDTETEIQLLSLLQAVLEAAAGEIRMPPYTFNQRFSAKDNIELLAALLGLPDHESVPLASIEKSRMERCLLRCKMYENCHELDIAKTTEQICSLVPVGFPDLTTLPANLVHTLQHETVNIIRTIVARIFHKVPSLQGAENEMLAFICSCAYLQTIDTPICELAASGRGRRFYQSTLQGFREKETLEQTTLRLSALLSFEALRPSCTDQDFGPVGGCYLHDFHQHLNGTTLSNRQAMLQRMALSIRRVTRGQHPRCTGFILDEVEERPLHYLDGISDQYWEYKFQRRLTHEDAWKEVWERLNEDFLRCIPGFERTTDV
ncbi:hypothetical protein F5883DRAFT_582937 [Diaporthe sp. PMI_573]|nr:hypothetical protein F5883DRAFT_582937 [Diaporthaceae sp. PMI_573]